MGTTFNVANDGTVTLTNDLIVDTNDLFVDVSELASVRLLLLLVCIL